MTHTPAGGLTIPPSNPDQNNRLTGIFQYDPSGNITLPASNSNGILTPLTHTYSSDAENRIYVVDGTTQYLYDPEGHRVATKTSGSVTNEYLYDFDGNLVTTLGTNKKMQRGFVYAGGQHWADYNGTTNKTEFQFSDTTGTFTTKFDQSGNALEVCYSGPFGEGLSCSGSTDYSELHFANKKRDSESGNDYFGARYYSSMMGRFLSPDWSTKPEDVPYADLMNPQSLNLYSYVNNNPLSKIDKDGHCGDGDDSACSKNLSVTQVTNIVYNETQSIHGGDVSLSDARQSVAHAIINGDNAKGDNRPATASDKVNAANQQTQTYKDTQSDVKCACQEASQGVDPTNGAQNFNLRPNDSTKPFQGADIQTQSGPFTNSYPTKDLPKSGIYVNTYKQPTPAPKPTPPPPPPPPQQKQPQ